MVSNRIANELVFELHSVYGVQLLIEWLNDFALLQLSPLCGSYFSKLTFVIPYINYMFKLLMNIFIHINACCYYVWEQFGRRAPAILIIFALCECCCLSLKPRGLKPRFLPREISWYLLNWLSFSILSCLVVELR